jgi:serine protease AprX
MASRFRVIVHGMNEDEFAAAERLISRPKRTPAFVTGEADENQIAELNAAHLIVDTLAEIDEQGRPLRARPEMPGTGTAYFGLARATTFSTEMFQAGEAADLPEPTRSNVYLIQLNGPLLDDWKQALERLDVHLMQSYGDNCYSAFLSKEQRDKINALDFVATTTVYGARQTVPMEGIQLLGAFPPEADVGIKKTYDVRLHRTEDMDSVSTWLEQRNVPIAGKSGQKLRIVLLKSSPLRHQIAALPEVQLIEEYVPPKLFNDHARALMHVDNSPLGALPPLDGKGEIVGIADTGIDAGHQDFSGRILKSIPRGRPGPGLTDDPHGHGTHVAGSIAGSGAAASGSYKGTAPATELVVQSLLDAKGGLSVPVDYGELLDEAYKAGVRIHNNSWGSATLSTYTTGSSEVDDFVSKNRDMLVVVAAGNEGRADNNRHSLPGAVDWLSIRSPATAKNALTVGASRSDRTAGGYSNLTWGQQFAPAFPDKPIATETISGNPECMAGFSSRGPSDDRRIKPDVVAPGTDIISTKSSTAPTTPPTTIFWGLVPNQSEYAYLGGSSMATPIVSGCAALVRQYYRQNGHAEPSAALLRATIINGTRWLSGTDSNASNPAGIVPPGNYDQGFGCVDMRTTLPNFGNPDFQLDFADNWKNPGDLLSGVGAVRYFKIQVGSRYTLRICMAYTDVPGRGLQNNLNLIVEAPDGQNFVGNSQLRDMLGGTDRDNTVEVVRVTDPKPGRYLIQISATTLLRDKQDFALVVAGDLGGAKLQKT